MKTIERVRIAALACVALAAACKSSSPAPGDPVGWHGRVDIYGTMHEVMMEHKTQGRVALTTQQGDAKLVAIGSLAGLEGEIVVLDGSVWTTRATALGALETHAGATQGEQATLLVSTRVEAWDEIPIPGGVTWAGLETFVASAARDHGLGRTQVFPFVIEGELTDARVHVLRGRCPEAGPGPAETEPVRRLLPIAHGRLVGFYSEFPPGTLTHQGQKAHVHLLVKEGEPLAAHVDDLRVAPGAVLKLPRGS